MEFGTEFFRAGLFGVRTATMTMVNPADISLRPARDGDEPFLKRVHEAARHWEFASLLQTGQEDLYYKIMAQQYDSQHRFYFANYGAAHYGVIQWTGQPVGRLYVDYRDAEVRVLEIAILPEYRGRGIGRIVMTGLCLEAAMRKKPVRLHVHYLSRAQRFYQQLGFREIALEGPDRLMEWHHQEAEGHGRILHGSAAPT
jgi:ribosomal protein S18 acetylase RimI-like enzyme